VESWQSTREHENDLRFDLLLSLGPGLLARSLKRGDPSRSVRISEFVGDTELARFCDIAGGSASELEYRLLLAYDLKLIQPDDYEQLVQQTADIKRMLTVFVRKLRAGTSVS
jgi:hypothetical protein